MNYIFSIIGVLISSGTLFVQYKQYRLDRKLKDTTDVNKKDKLLLRINKYKRFSVGLIVLLIVALIFMSYQYLHISNENLALKKNKKERIVLLAPINPDIKNDAYDDGERQALGLIDYLSKHNEIAGKYNFVIRNHGLNYGNNKGAEDIVIEELENGTKYFISTMSSVCNPLSENFNNLVKKNYKNIDEDKPILISTVASSPTIANYLNDTNIFRFYIRSNEESDVLANEIHKINLFNNATAIAVNDEYGKGAVSRFKEQWTKLGHTFNDGIYIDIKSEYKSVKQNIEENIKNRYNKNNREIIFIANYGGGLDKIIKSIYELKMNPIIVATSTLSIKEWQEPIKEALDSLRWITCVPKLKNSGGKSYEGDVVEDFVYFTLDRLVSVIEKSKKTGRPFEEVWHTLYEPKRIDYIIEDGDSKIKLQIYKQNF